MLDIEVQTFTEYNVTIRGTKPELAKLRREIEALKLSTMLPTNETFPMVTDLLVYLPE